MPVANDHYFHRLLMAIYFTNSWWTSFYLGLILVMDGGLNSAAVLVVFAFNLKAFVTVPRESG